MAGVQQPRLTPSAMGDTRPQVYVNVERTRLVWLFPDGMMTFAERDEPGHVWGPPVHLVREDKPREGEL